MLRVEIWCLAAVSVIESTSSGGGVICRTISRTDEVVGKQLAGPEKIPGVF